MIQRITWEDVRAKIVEMQEACMQSVIVTNKTERESDVQRGRYTALKELQIHFDKIERN